MKHAVASILTVAWALWFGATIALALFVMTLFAGDKSLPADAVRIAPQAAPQLFQVFADYQLVLSVVVLLAAFIWRILRPHALITTIFALLAACALAAVYFKVGILSPMQKIQGDPAQKPEFQRLHKRSERLVGVQAILLLSAGVLIPLAAARANPVQPAPDGEAPSA